MIFGDKLDLSKDYFAAAASEVEDKENSNLTLDAMKPRLTSTIRTRTPLWKKLRQANQSGILKLPWKLSKSF